MMKTDPALTPLLILGIDIFGYENNLLCLSNQVIFFGAGIRNDKRKDRAAIRRGDRYPSATAFKTVISDQTESKLIEVELQAPIMIVNENR